MKRVLLTGMSGTGKSTLIGVLAEPRLRRATSVGVDTSAALDAVVKLALDIVGEARWRHWIELALRAVAPDCADDFEPFSRVRRVRNLCKLDGGGKGGELRRI